MFGISLPGLGDIAEKFCDSVLPKELHIVGDVVGGIVNFETGNYAGALRQGMEMFGDLKDLQQSLGKLQQQDNARGPAWSHEPPPPVFRGNWREAAQSLLNPAKALKDTTVWRGSPPAADAGKPTKANETAKPDAKAKSDDTKEPAAPKETTEAKEPKATTESKSKTETNKVVEDFFKKSPDDFMKAISDGKIPPEVSDSKEQMLRLQTKMQHITEMNQLMTSMLAAIHQMQMAIINNVRV